MGWISVSAGTLQIGGAGLLCGGVCSGFVGVSSGATFQYSSSASQAIQRLNGSGAILKDTSSSSTFTMTDASQAFTGAITINAGTVQISGSGRLNVGNYSGAMTIASGGTFEYSSSAAQTLSGVISGAGAITKDTDSSSILTLSGANTFTGTTNINAGKINVGSSGAFGSSSTINFGGGTLQYSASNTTDYSSFFNMAGSQAWSIDTNSQNVTFAGVLAGTSSSLAKSGSGTLTLTGVNTYTGGTTVSAGTLQIGSSGSLGSGSYAGAISIASGTFQYSSSAAQTLSGIINNGGALTKDTSSSALILTSASNNYSGAITISAGTLQVDGAGRLSSSNYSGTMSIASGATFEYSSSTSQIMLGTISGAGVIIKDTSAASTLTLSGTNTYTGATTINAGTIKAGNNTSSFGSNSVVTIASGATLDIGGKSNSIGSLTGAGTVSNSGAGATLNTGGDNSSTTFSGVIQNGSGAVGLTKSGSGTFTLTNTNTYTAGTTVSAGILQIGSSGSLGSGSYAGAISIASGATLQYSSSATTLWCYIKLWSAYKRH